MDLVNTLSAYKNQFINHKWVPYAAGAALIALAVFLIFCVGGLGGIASGLTLGIGGGVLIYYKWYKGKYTASIEDPTKKKRLTDSSTSLFYEKADGKTVRNAISDFDQHGKIVMAENRSNSSIKKKLGSFPPDTLLTELDKEWYLYQEPQSKDDADL